MSHDIDARKRDHIDLCATGDVGFRDKTTLFDQVELVHDALPELDVDEIDTRRKVLGKELKAPIFISAMTGGTARARDINKQLAAIAERRGLGFGLGSQRAMLDPAAAKDETYVVRDVAPTALILGNLGGVQAMKTDLEAARSLVERVGADALCVHLNPAQELVQPGGDRGFKGVLAAIERFTKELGVPVVAKETGCGIGPSAAQRLAKAGVRHVDVSGSGGTSWVAVETARADGAARTLGLALRDWGVPTAASVIFCRAARPRFKTIIATGGITSGLDVARAIALGATVAGIARPVLQALVDGGPEKADAFLAQVELELRSAMLLSGCKTLNDLEQTDLIVGAGLERWSPASVRTGASLSRRR
jgi:isopentenyl-diphosphate delta-isomerase